MAYQRGVAIAEALRRSASSCLSRSVMAMSRMEQFGSVIARVSWRHWLRAVRKMVRGGRADGCSILVSRLSAVLEDVTYCDVPGWSILLALTAAMAPLRPNCVTENTGRTVELAQLGNTF